MARRASPHWFSATSVTNQRHAPAPFGQSPSTTASLASSPSPSPTPKQTETATDGEKKFGFSSTPEKVDQSFRKRRRRRPTNFFATKISFVVERFLGFKVTQDPNKRNKAFENCDRWLLKQTSLSTKPCRLVPRGLRGRRHRRVAGSNLRRL